MGINVTKNDDGTYKICKETSVETDISKEELETRVETLKANLVTTQTEIDELESTIEQIKSLE